MCSCWAFNPDVVNDHGSDLRCVFFFALRQKKITTMNWGTFFVLQVDLGPGIIYIYMCIIYIIYKYI